MDKMDQATKKRVRTIYILLTGVFALFIIRVGYIQFIYQNDMVTFAQMEQNVQELNVPIIENVKRSFHVELNDYKEVTTDEIINNGKTDVGSLSLLNIVYSSCESGCVGRPAIFVKDASGYVFLKNKIGENILVEIKRTNDRWMKTTTQTR